MPLPIPPHPDSDERDHARRWLRHVEAGRIGSPAPRDPQAEQARLEKLAADERAVLGEVLSVKRVWPELPRSKW